MSVNYHPEILRVLFKTLQFCVLAVVWEASPVSPNQVVCQVANLLSLKLLALMAKKSGSQILGVVPNSEILVQKSFDKVNPNSCCVPI